MVQVGLYEDAVALALTFDRELAIATARRPEADEALNRKLWLAIARHMVSTGASEGGSDAAATQVCMLIVVGPS